MKKHLRCFASFVLVAFFGLETFAQSFSVTYDFAGVTASSGRTDPTTPPNAPGVTFGSFTATSTLSTNSSAGGRFSFSNWPLGATDGNNSFTGSIDETKYYSVTIAPQANYTIDLTNITFTLTRSGTGVRQYAVRSSKDAFVANLSASIVPSNASLQVVPTNVFQVADVTTILDGSAVTLTGFTSISSPVTFRFYGFNAEGTGGTFSIDNVKFTGTAVVNAAAPNITVTPASLDFPTTSINTTGGPLTYTVKGNNLIAPIVLSTAGPYSISDAISGTYSTSLTLAATDVATPKTVYIKFSPTTIGTFSGTITHTSTNAGTQTVALTGQSVDPNNLTFNFNTCTNLGAPGSGFTTYSDSGAQVWTCTTFGRNSTNGVNMNGFSGSTAVGNSDWLISPPLNIGVQTLPVLRFWSRGEFSGPSLQVLISTNYSGTGDPNVATWTDLNANLPPLTNTWTLTDGINLSAYKSSPQVYIAFKYLSTVDDGAARWTLDDVDITNRSTILTTFASSLSFGEAAINTVSTGNRFSVQSTGYGDLTVTAPAHYQVSTDSLTGYGSTVSIPQATAQAGTILFARFAPTVKALNLQGQIRIMGTGLDSNTVYLSGTSYPKAETFDVGCYNLSFFGSNSSNNPTPQKITTQIANISTVLKRLNLDITGVEEVSSDSAFSVLLNTLPNRKAVISDRWSYSFNPPDPGFPPQKTGFIYDSTTVQLVESRDLFVKLYDSVLNGYSGKLPNYPGGTPQSFWASGRLPFMATFNVTVGGVTKKIHVVDIHAKSSSDIASYNRRVYDVKVLKDSLDAYYSTDNVIIVGDYNDRVFGTIYGGSGATSPYKPFVDDNTDYSVLTYPLDQAGRVSFVSGTGLIDQITISNELTSFAIPNSTDIEDPRSYISGYGANTASDHLPVYSRFSFPAAAPLPVALVSFGAAARSNDVVVSWTTATELNSSHFIVERAGNGIDFSPIGSVAANGNSSAITNYQFIDNSPLTGRSFYRLKPVDKDGKSGLSKVVNIYFGRAGIAFTIYPNPVKDHLQIAGNLSDSKSYRVQIIAADGRIILEAKGNVSLINQRLEQQFGNLSNGVYTIRLGNEVEQYTQKFIKQ